MTESENSTSASTHKVASDLISKADLEAREKELRMENLAKFKSIKSMNDRFRNFVTSFQDNEKILAQKFKASKIVNDDGLLEKDLDLKIPLNATDAPLQKRPSRRHLTDTDFGSGCKSARNRAELDPIFSEELPFATEGNLTGRVTVRAKAHSGDLNDESFSGFSEEEKEPEASQITHIEKFINEIGYKHQIIQLSCQVPILSQLNSLQKEIDTCEKQFNDLLNDQIQT